MAASGARLPIVRSLRLTPACALVVPSNMSFMAQRQLGSETGHLQLHDRGFPTPVSRRRVTVPTWTFDSFVANRSGAMRDYTYSTRYTPIGRERVRGRGGASATIDAAQPTFVAWLKIDAE